MRDLTEFEKGPIVGARIVAASVTKTAELHGFSRDTRTMMEFMVHGKPSSDRSNSGWTSKLTDRDRRALKLIVKRNQRTTATKVIVALTRYLNSPVLSKTVRCELNKAGYDGKTAIRKPLLSIINIQKKLK